jgi:hypothetical protein
VADYTKLAEKAKAIQDAANQALHRQRDLESDPSVFFQRVTAAIGEEMNKANVELLRREVGTIARNHLPNFPGVIFLAFGTESLCRVELEVQDGKARIKAAISGPPNGYETSRKEYLIGENVPGSEPRHGDKAGIRAVGTRPEQIAEDIISGILIGKLE